MNARTGRGRREMWPTRSPLRPTGSPPGEFDADFPIDVFQTGSGTSSNMNANEVIATPRHRSTGPQGAPERPRQRLAVVQRRVPDLDPRRRDRGRRPRPDPGTGPPRRRRWRPSATQWATVVKSGRTHLMDATPVTLGQEFGGYAAQVAVRDRTAAVRHCPGSPSCRWAGPRSAPGSTLRPVSPPRSSRSWPTATGLPFTEAAQPLRGAGRPRRPGRGLRSTAHASPCRLTKICNDIRWMGSGPRAGLAEIHLPGPAARLVDHARQGQPGAAGGDR